MIYVKGVHELIDIVGDPGPWVKDEWSWSPNCFRPESLHPCNPVSQSLVFHLLGPVIISGDRQLTIHSHLWVANHK